MIDLWVSVSRHCSRVSFHFHHLFTIFPCQTLFKGKQSEGMLGDSGAALNFNVSVQADPKEEKKKKEKEEVGVTVIQ